MKGKELQNKGFEITLDKKRHLLFDLNALCELEDKFEDIDTAFALLDKGSMKAVRALLYAGLIHEDENLTEKKVGGLITLENINTLAEVISQAVNMSLPETVDAGTEKNEIAKTAN